MDKNQLLRIRIKALREEISRRRNLQLVQESYITDDEKLNLGPGKFKKVMIEIRSRDPGAYPHFHIIGEKCTAAICIDIPKYFNHHPKDRPLSNSEMERLVEFLKLPHKKDKNVTNWEYIRDAWNRNGSNRFKTKPLDCEMPDYLHMEGDVTD